MNSAAASTETRESRARSANPLGNLSPVRRFVAPAVPGPFAIVETVLFMAIAIGLAWAYDHADPLMLHAGFAWLWLAPLVVALRYGTLLGLLAGGVVVAAWYGLYPRGSAWPLMYFTGGFIQSIVAGHFGDTWGSRAARSRALNDYLNDRLVAITNSHYLMRLSHERLEKDLLSKPTTLRDSITELRRLSVAQSVGQSNGGGQPGVAPAVRADALPGAQPLLEFVAQACQIEIAALHSVRGGRIAEQAAARIGEPFDLDMHDELVAHAVETLGVAHLKSVQNGTNGEATITSTRYVVCAPVVSADGELIALVVVKRMPFLSLNYDNLQLLLVLLGYYADGVEHTSLVQGVLDAVPGCPYDFALDLARLARLKRSAGIDSSLVALTFMRDEAGESLFEHVMRRRRALDVMWPVQSKDRSVLINLMPATDTTGIDGYLARIEASLKAQFDTDLEGARIGVHTLHLEHGDPGPALGRLLKRAGVDAEAR
ncbi:PelD GGDEF domain-containing protein [Paraburkholderia kururiensis]|uniref:PelD GGDEF domain-containing protein n=1 Tax=Paraburkholderia kururiensis TaxID=984307 RepID=UPI0018F6E8D4|nr:PelD GGDEF domain-containing protein [Paraburkholderia kururiensis]